MHFYSKWNLVTSRLTLENNYVLSLKACIFLINTKLFPLLNV